MVTSRFTIVLITVLISCTCVMSVTIEKVDDSEIDMSLGGGNSGGNEVTVDMEEHFMDQLEKIPDSADAYLGLGIIRFKQKRLGEAASYFEKAMRSDPKFDKAYYNRAMLYMQDSNYADAAELLDQATRLNQDELKYQRELAQVHLYMGNYAEAVEIFDELMGTILDDPNMRVQMSIALFHSNEFKRADGVLKDAAKDPRIENPTRALIFLHRGLALAQLGDHTRAVRNLKSALKYEARDEKKATILFNLAAAQQKMGKPDKAIQSLSTCVELSKDGVNTEVHARANGLLGSIMLLKAQRLPIGAEKVQLMSDAHEVLKAAFEEGKDAETGIAVAGLELELHGNFDGAKKILKGLADSNARARELLESLSNKPEL